VDREGPELDEHPMPDVPPPEEVEVLRRPADPGPDVPFRTRFEMRPAIGALPFEGGPEAITGGWIRTTEHDPVDAVLLTAIMDSWPPAIFARLDVPIGVPTVDLTVHLRRRPTPGDEWVLVRFRTTVAADGFLEEDGEAWSRDGRLIAHARQLGVLIP
jgi:acyl-CoA thioesterase